MLLERSHLERLITSRKMCPSDVLAPYSQAGDHVLIPDDDLPGLADRLIVPTTLLVSASPAANDEAEQTDLDGGVKVYRADEGFRRTISRSGTTYYTYQHLATTKAAPELMALKVTLHCDDSDSVVFNGGHDSKELIYVLHGRVRMDWESSDGRRTEILESGDSAYLRPGVSHSFISASETAEIIAVNYA